MATYKVGNGATADYATFTVAEAALTLPEAEGTTYEVTGVVLEDFNFNNVKYANGLVLTALTGEEADGNLGGAYINGAIQINIPLNIDAFVSNLNIKSFGHLDTLVEGTVNIDNCDIGNGTVVDSIQFRSTSLIVVTNTIIRDGADDNVYSAVLAAGVLFDRCSSVNASRIGFIRATYTDCLAFGSGTGDDFHADSGATSDFLASEDLTATISAATTGLNGRTSADFVNYAGGDFNLAPASSLNTSGSAGGIIGAVLAAPATSGSTPINTIINNLLSGNGSI